MRNRFVNQTGAYVLGTLCHITEWNAIERKFGGCYNNSLRKADKNENCR